MALRRNRLFYMKYINTSVKKTFFKKTLRLITHDLILELK